MFKLKKDDYLASLNRARKKRNRGDYKKYALIAAGAVVIIGAVVFAGLFTVVHYFGSQHPLFLLFF